MNAVSKVMIAVFAVGLSLAATGLAQVYAPNTTPSSRDDYTAAQSNAGAQYRIDQDACSVLVGNAKDVCEARAKGKEGVARADAKSAYEDTPSAREHASLSKAQADYNVAIEECADFAGDRRNVCVREATNEFARDRNRANDERAANDARRDAAARPAVVRNQGYADMRAAEYAIVIEACNSRDGPARNACVSNADVKYGSNAYIKYGMP
jgi:hypothetical protein